jgi:hypothetical protein
LIFVANRGYLLRWLNEYVFENCKYVPTRIYDRFDMFIDDHTNRSEYYSVLNGDYKDATMEYIGKLFDDIDQETAKRVYSRHFEAYE